MDARQPEEGVTPLNTAELKKAVLDAEKRLTAETGALVCVVIADRVTGDYAFSVSDNASVSVEILRGAAKALETGRYTEE